MAAEQRKHRGRESGECGDQPPVAPPRKMPASPRHLPSPSQIRGVVTGDETHSLVVRARTDVVDERLLLRIALQHDAVYELRERARSHRVDADEVGLLRVPE